MALETLKDVPQIGGFQLNQLSVEEYDIGMRLKDCADAGVFINVNHGTNEITFKIQDGPVHEKGINGCQVDTIIETAKVIIEGLNNKFPCRENSIAITKLDEALLWLLKRKLDRQSRGVEGTSQQ